MKDLLQTATGIAREAGALLLPYYHNRVELEYKAAGGTDIVTDADRASEALIVARLREYFPDHAVVAEEGSGYAGQSGYCWYIDPLDGTTNFAHTFPMFCVSMGLQKDGEIVAGVIFDPVHNDLFAAEKGSGAQLNGEAIHVSSVARLAEALAATGFSANRQQGAINIHFFHHITMRSHGVRRPGAAALDLAYVAAGRLDCFWEFNLKPWDVAAGKLIVQEAGGTVTDMQGQPHLLTSTSITASNGLFHGELLETFEEIFSGIQRIPLPEIIESEPRQ